MHRALRLTKSSHFINRRSAFPSGDKMTDKPEHIFETGPIALAIIVAAVLFSASFYFAPGKTSLLSQQPQTHIISVSADASQEVAPDKVEITFSVVSRGMDPSAIQEENDAKIRTIQSALVALGVQENNIKTIGYSLDRWTEYNKTQERYVDMGYELRNSLRVVSYDVASAGKITREAVSKGANDVSGIQFMLSDASQKKLYGQLLSQAASTAKDKAQNMATAAGVKIAGLSSMNEGYSYVAPMANYDYRSTGVGEGKAPAPEVAISAGLVKVSASVSAQYEIGG